MLRKLHVLLFVCLMVNPMLFGQIVFQESVVDTTNSFSISTVNLSNGQYSVRANYSGDFDGDGDIDLLPKSNPLLWIENTDGLGDLSVQHLIDDGVGAVKALSVNDIDGDGDLDILIAENNFPDDIIGWYENTDGLGNFSAKQTISTQVDNLSTLYIKDLDGDTDLDVISASIGNGEIAWYENTDGQATFGPQQLITTASFSSTTQYIEVVSADFDGDLDNDILFAANGSPDQAVYWIENTDGSGTFANIEEVIDVFGGMFYLKLADLDDDGDIDVYGQNSFDGLLSITNDGSGNFSFGNMFSTSYDGYTGFAQAFDVDGDTDLDMFGFVRNDDDVNEIGVIWFENTDAQGAFSNEQIIETINFTTLNPRFDVADFDGDGNSDLICHNVDGFELSWKKNEMTSGTFGNSQGIIYDLKGVRDAISIDVDGDADKDIVFTSYENNTLGWYENLDGLGTYGSQIVISASMNGGDWITSTDIDDDGDVDLIGASRVDDRVVWYENDGSGNFVQSEISNTANGARFLIAVDINGDDAIDVVSLEEFGDAIVWYENTDGFGGFGPKQIIIDSLDDIKSFDLGDLDDDGDLDLIISESLSWMSNDGSGSFSAPQSITSTNNGAVKIADLDDDGDIDIITSDPFGWHENEDGLGTFGEFQLIDDQVFSNDDLLIADIDGDGNLDVLNSFLVSNSNYEVKFYKNYGGVFSPGSTIGFTDDRLSALFVDDLDGNGTEDVLYATDKLTNGSGKIAWFRNVGELNNQISGTVTYDADLDGCDVNDLNVSNVMVAAGNSGASFTTFTDNNGAFLLDVNQGDLITTITPNLPDYFTLSPMFHNSSFDGENDIDDMANFCITPNATTSDLNISLYPLSPPRPGFDTSYEIVYNNIGTTTLSGTVDMAFDSTKMQYVTASEAPVSQSGNTISFDFIDLLPFESRSIVVEFSVFTPPTTNINDVVNTVVSVSPMSGDITEDDNTYTLEQTVIDSYDPNDIIVLEGEQILLEQTDDYLHYIIRFQNTGTAEAINVRVTNIIDPKLEWFSLQLESLSHDGRLDIEDGIQATFTFENIMLPSVNDDEAGSNGYIAYKIKPSSGAIVGDVFSNSASIFFDFNSAIVTNTVTTEVVDALSVNEIQDQSLVLFPNPTKGIFSIKSTLLIDKLTITDVNGRLVKVFTRVNNETISVEDLNSGIYVVKMISGEHTTVRKLIKN
ncbi:T9SS type A sorting domain-containing protein [Psychroserpens sp. MEBiC05023]